jgi:MATE family multidrug resistance protein
MALSQLAIMSMVIVDTMFVGRLGALPLASVAVGNSVASLFLTIGIGLHLGLDYWISKSVGEGEHEEGVHYLIQGLYLGTFVSLPLVMLSYLLSSPSLGFFALFKIPPLISAQAVTYLRIATWSIWPVLLFTSCRQYLQALNQAVYPMLIVIFANLINALANWVLVLGHLGFPRLGVSGAAIATLISRGAMFAGILAYLLIFERARTRERSLAGEPRKTISRKLSVSKLLQVIQLGIPAATQTLFEVGVFAAATLIVGRLGAATLGAHQIVLQIASTTFMIPLGLSSAAAVLVARNMGASNPEGAIKFGWMSLRLSTLMMAGIGLMLYLTARPLMMIFTRDPSVIEIGASLLLIVAIFQIADGLQVVGNGVLRGIGNTRTSMIANFVGHWMIGLPLGYWLCFRVGYGVRGIWIGLSFGLIAVAVMLIFMWGKKSAKLVSQA